MKTRAISIFVGVVATIMMLASSAHAASPLVDSAWVKANTGAKNTVFIDLRGKGAYMAGHVPGAVHSSYGGDKWRMKKGQIKGLLPETSHLQALIRRLGVNNDTHVVLMHGGSSAAETGIATRIYWTFLVLGHDNVSILNGGMRGYMKDKANPLAKGNVVATTGTFTAKMDTTYLATAKDVVNAIATKVTLLDSRPTDQNVGVNKSGSVTRYGTLPGAISVPGRWLTVNDKGTFRDAASVMKIYASQKAPTSGKSIVFCNTGHWASLGWFVDSQILGNKSSKMYDGSMAEWSRMSKAEHPMTARLNLN